MNELIEQRKYIRHPTSIAIRIFRENHPPIELSPLANVSIGGFCCRTFHELVAGGQISIEFPVLPENPRLVGHVVWCHCRHEGYDIGVEFDDEQEAYRARVCEQLCHIETYRRALYDTEGRSLTSDQAAVEWIDKHAADFP